MDDKPKVRRIDFYPGDWLGGTIGMRADEIGVYIQICALIYDRGGPVHIDQVRAASGLHGNALRRVLDKLRDIGKIEGKDAEISNKRCENELEKSQKLIEKARENGIKGNDIRWNRIATPPLDSDPSGARSVPPPPSDSKSLNNGAGGKWKRAGAVAPETPSAAPRNPAPPHKEPIISGYNPNNVRSPGEAEWRQRLKHFRESNGTFWPDNAGPNPYDSRCWLLVSPADIPHQHLLTEFGFR